MKNIALLVVAVVGGVLLARLSKSGAISNLWSNPYRLSTENPLGRVELLDESFQKDSGLVRGSPTRFQLDRPGVGGRALYPPQFLPEKLAAGLVMHEYVDPRTLEGEVVECVRLVVEPSGKVVAILGTFPWGNEDGPANRGIYRTPVGRLMSEFWSIAIGGSPNAFEGLDRALPQYSRSVTDGQAVSAEWLRKRQSYEKVYLTLR